MRKKKLFVVSAILIGAILLSGCTGATVWPGLSAAGDVAYLANTRAVNAIDIQSGKEMWHFSEGVGGFLNFNPSMYVTTPVVTPDGLIILLDSSNKHVMYAVDQNFIKDNIPAIKWEFSEVGGLWIAPPLIVDDRLFAPNSDGKVYVLDLQDGELVEIIEVSKPGEGEARLWAQPVTDGERLFVTSLDKSVLAIDLATYDILWHEDLGGAIPGGVAIGGDGMLYVGSLAKQLERFDPLTGAHEAVLDTHGWMWGTPVADGDNLYFADVDGYFYSYNTKEGKLNFEPVQPDASITANPLVLGDHVLVSTESGGVYSISANGEVDLWFDEDNKGKAYTTPILSDGLVLVAYTETDYYLVALDEEGDVKWKFPSGE